MRTKALFFALLFIFSGPASTQGRSSLWLVEKRIDITHSVPNITHQELIEKLSSKDAAQYVLFDVREKDEYAVSHLACAHLLDPRINPR